MLDQAFLLGVTVKACDRAQPTGNGRSSPPVEPRAPARALDVHAVHVEEAALMVRAPRSELSQVQRVGLTGGTR
jgi:hypothetical protein